MRRRRQGTGQVALKKPSTLLSLGGVYSPTYTFSDEYKAVLDQATALGYAKPSFNQRILQDTLMRTLVSSGVFAKSDLIYVMLNDAGINFGRINWKNPAAFTLSVNGPVQFMSNYGCYTPTDVAVNKAWFGTGWVPATNGVNFTLNANSIISRTASGYGASGFLTSTLAVTNRILVYQADRIRAVQNNAATAASVLGITTCFTLMNRRTGATASGLHLVQAGVVVDDIVSAIASSGFSTDELWFAGYGGVDLDYPFASLGVGHPYEFFSVGANLTNPEFIALDAALITYANSMRYSIPIYGSGNYTVPAGITQLFVECFGGGGGGRGYPNAAQTTTGGGGGGGAYSASLVSVTPGQIIPVIVSGGSSVGTGAGGNGGDTSWNGGVVLAKGGQGAGIVPAVAALGGQASAGVGDIKFSGGNGGLGGPTLNSSTGAGGSGAGALGNGLIGMDGVSGMTLGRRTLYNVLGPSNPGFSQSNGVNGPGIDAALASGGGGARRTSTTKAGGGGGQGYIRVSAPKVY